MRVWDRTQRDFGVPCADPWNLLTVIALATRVRLRAAPAAQYGRRRPTQDSANAPSAADPASMIADSSATTCQ